MFGKKTQIIKFEQNADGITADNKEILFVRVKEAVEDKNALLEVPASHDAYVTIGGGDIRFFKSGTYPILDDKKDVNIWKKGATVDVIYIPKETNLKILWGTPNKFIYRDFASSKVVNIGARGQFRVEITNPEQFIRKVVGPKNKFVADDFQEEFCYDVVNEFRDSFLKVVDEQKLSYDQFDLHLRDIGVGVGKALKSAFDKSWGVGIADFVILTVEVDDSDVKAVEDAAADMQKNKKLQEYIDKIEQLEEKDWERKKYLEELKSNDINAYYEVLKVIGHAPAGSPTGVRSSGASGYCPSCGHPVGEGAKFCSFCGAQLATSRICPDCNTENDLNAAYCKNCGKKL